MMNVLLVACVVALSATCSHAIGEKIYLKADNNYHYPLGTRNAIFGDPTMTPEPGSIIVNMNVFKILLQKYVQSEMTRRQSAHRVFTPPVDMNHQSAAGSQAIAAPDNYMSAFTNDGTSSAYFKNRDQNVQNHPIVQPTQEELGSQGFANPSDPFTDRVYT